MIKCISVSNWFSKKQLILKYVTRKLSILCCRALNGLHIKRLNLSIFVLLGYFNFESYYIGQVHRKANGQMPKYVMTGCAIV